MKLWSSGFFHLHGRFGAFEQLTKNKQCSPITMDTIWIIVLRFCYPILVGPEPGQQIPFHIYSVTWKFRVFEGNVSFNDKPVLGWKRGLVAKSRLNAFYTSKSFRVLFGSIYRYVDEINHFILEQLQILLQSESYSGTRFHFLVRNVRISFDASIFVIDAGIDCHKFRTNMVVRRCGFAYAPSTDILEQIQLGTCYIYMGVHQYATWKSKIISSISVQQQSGYRIGRTYIIWTLNLSLIVKPRPQIAQICGLTSEWILLWHVIL